MDKFPPALAELRDIHLPEPVADWPWAPGWYGLIAVGVVLGGMLLWVLWRHYLHGRAKRHALQLLASYRQQYQQERDAVLACARVSELLKRVALAYFPRQRVAGLQGEEWLNFLQKTGKKTDFQVVRFELLELPYAACTTGHPELLFDVAQRWIAQRRAPCLN